MNWVKLYDWGLSLYDGSEEGYQIDWEQVATERQVLAWIRQLTEKMWVTNDTIHGFLCAVCGHWRWSLHI